MVLAVASRGFASENARRASDMLRDDAARAVPCAAIAAGGDERRVGDRVAGGDEWWL
jgi:hypothetical protein